MSLVRRIADLLHRLSGSRQPEPSPDEAERLSAIFRERYHSFRVLLAANGRALETMATMEQAYAGTRPYGMNFVVSNATSVAVRVYRMIQHLERLAPGKYSTLSDRFNAIRSELDTIIQPPPTTIDAPLVLPLDAIRRSDSPAVGAKMANLGESQIFRNQIFHCALTEFALNL